MSVTIDKSAMCLCAGKAATPACRPSSPAAISDTQPTGGKFDGNYGVLAALEVVRTLNDLQIVTDAPIEVVSGPTKRGRALYR